MKVARTIDGQLGEHIKDFAKRLISIWVSMSEVSDTDDFAIEGTFNKASLIAKKESTVESILSDYDNQLEVSRQKYINSDEYKEKQRQEQLELNKLNNEARYLMDKFSIMDFEDYIQVLLWLVEMQPYSDRIGVTIPNDYILHVLNKHGYKANANTKENFNGEDPENFARYIIGQCMNGLKNVGAIHYMAVEFTEDWKKKFCIN